MQDKLETRWTQEDTLNFYNPFREKFRKASANLVKGVFGQHVKPKDKIVEIGSGLGELVALVPELEDRIQQTEQSPKIVEGNRTLHPNSNVKTANVYDLPFSDGEFNLAVGYSVFDTLANLEEALSEVGRVLTPMGKFVHFLDIQASANTVFHRYESGDVVPFPLFELDPTNNLMYGTGVQLVQKKDLKSLRKLIVAVDEGLGNFFDIYVDKPEYTYVIGFRDSDFISILNKYSDFVYESGLDVQLIRFNDDFRRNLEQSLESSGYEILESGKKDGTVTVDRNGKYSDHPELNVFHNDVGIGRSNFDPSLSGKIGTDKVKVVSTHYVTVAQKVQPERGRII